MIGEEEAEITDFYTGIIANKEHDTKVDQKLITFEEFSNYITEVIISHKLKLKPRK